MTEKALYIIQPQFRMRVTSGLIQNTWKGFSNYIKRFTHKELLEFVGHAVKEEGGSFSPDRWLVPSPGDVDRRVRVRKVEVLEETVY